MRQFKSVSISVEIKTNESTIETEFNNAGDAIQYLFRVEKIEAAKEFNAVEFIDEQLRRLQTQASGGIANETYD